MAIFAEAILLDIFFCVFYYLIMYNYEKKVNINIECLGLNCSGINHGNIHNYSCLYLVKNIFLKTCMLYSSVDKR